MESSNPIMKNQLLAALLTCVAVSAYAQVAPTPTSETVTNLLPGQEMVRVRLAPPLTVSAATVLPHHLPTNGLDALALTKLDVLDGLKEIKVCVGYELNGKRVDILPLDADDIVACKPIYDTFPGWTQTTAGITEWDKLPMNARKYLERVEEFIGAPIDMVSTGPDREDTIVLRHPYNA